MAGLQWRVWVDWEGDGAWGAAGKEVAADVMELRWRWGRWADGEGPARPELAAADQDGGRAAGLTPARLELTLRNFDHKYTPGNGESPLAGKVAAGRPVWAALAYPWEEGGGVDGTDLAGRMPAVGTGAAWVKESGGSSGLVLGGGQIRPQRGSGECIYTLDFGAAEGQIGFNYRRGSNGKGGVALRLVSVWDYLRVRFGNSGTLLEKVSFGYPTVLRRGPALTAGVNYFIEIELHGDGVRLFATDLDGGTADRRQILDGQGQAGNLTAGKHGLWHDGTADLDRWDNFGGWRSLFYGTVESLSPERDGERGEVCRLTAVDGLAGLEQIRLFNLLTGRNLNAAAIANRLLTWAGFSANHRRLESGPTLIADEPRALWDLTAAQALAALQRETDGFIYQDGRGYLRLETAGHRAAGAHTAVQGVFGGAAAVNPAGMQRAAAGGDNGVENVIAFRYRRAENRGLQEIWRLRERAAVPAGASREFLAESGSYDLADRIRLPLAVTDYAANSRAEGGGADLTGSLAVSLPYVGGNGGPGYQGKGTVVRVENRHATATAYLALLRLQADRAYRDYEPVSCQAVNAASQTRYGVRSRVVDCRFIDHYAAARRMAAARLARRQEPRPAWILTLTGGDSGNWRQIVQRVLSDRIRVSCPERGVNGDFFIEGMELTAVARTGEVRARWRLRAAD